MLMFYQLFIKINDNKYQMIANSDLHKVYMYYNLRIFFHSIQKRHTQYKSYQSEGVTQATQYNSTNTKAQIQNTRRASGTVVKQSTIDNKCDTDVIHTSAAHYQHYWLIEVDRS